jgi:hypothetical protein
MKRNSGGQLQKYSASVLSILPTVAITVSPLVCNTEKSFSPPRRNSKLLHTPLAVSTRSKLTAFFATSRPVITRSNVSSEVSFFEGVSKDKIANLIAEYQGLAPEMSRVHGVSLVSHCKRLAFDQHIFGLASLVASQKCVDRGG